MIVLEKGSVAAAWFVWCVDHLPLTGATDYVAGKAPQRRKGAYYLEHGTTLCHVFWAILWVPLLAVAAISIMVGIFGAAHYETYLDHKQTLGVWGFFIPEGIILAAIALLALAILTVCGVGNTGFFRALWAYVKALKSRICPLVRFDGQS